MKIFTMKSFAACLSENSESAATNHQNRDDITSLIYYMFMCMNCWNSIKHWWCFVINSIFPGETLSVLLCYIATNSLECKFKMNSSTAKEENHVHILIKSFQHYSVKVINHDGNNWGDSHGKFDSYNETGFLYVSLILFFWSKR